MAPSGTPSKSPFPRWIILVPRGQDDLLDYLVRAFQGDTQVEVVMDRRRDLRRNPSRVLDSLRFGRVVVIRRER
jgi:hypothetical protein